MDTLQPKKFNILLIGDNCRDVYQYGTVDRLSPEAPVPVFKFSHEETRAGMAGNVCTNLLRFGLNLNFLHSETSTKTRLIDIKSNQHIVRLDNDIMSTAITVDSKVPEIYDAIVISDYNKGTVSYELVEELRKEFKGPIFIDTKKTDLARFEGCIVKINQLESSRATSFPSPQWLITTIGDQGAVWNGCIFESKTVGVVDVTGAGDTFLAALAFDYLHTQDFKSAIEFANAASAVTVQHGGVYAPSLEEIQ